jgi:predicted dehydrogenase
MIWLIGLGNMGIEYAKVLNALNIEYLAIGRSEKTANHFESSVHHRAITGGISDFLKTTPAIPDKVIIAVNIVDLYSTTESLLLYGVKNILLEKPGGTTVDELNKLFLLAVEKQSNVMIAYNRRFYASVLAAEKMIEEDGGVDSFNFEFTEWAHEIGQLNMPEVTFKNWFLANSSHVVDLAFFIGGFPVELYPLYTGSLTWHPSASVFVGAGKSDKGALFSYNANWDAPGRWGVEILTKYHRLYFRPMEKLQIQNKGSVEIAPVDVNYELDLKYKPGLYLQTKNFIEGKHDRFCTIKQQYEHTLKFYSIMSNE